MNTTPYDFIERRVVRGDDAAAVFLLGMIGGRARVAWLMVPKAMEPLFPVGTTRAFRSDDHAAVDRRLRRWWRSWTTC